jgi:hypothetical protein
MQARMKAQQQQTPKTTLKDASIEQLKVAAYDDLVAIEQLQAHLRACNEEIARRMNPQPATTAVAPEPK